MFIERPVSKGSIAKRKCIHGKGVNDASYVTTSVVNGKKLMCPFYSKWVNMITRCYSVNYLRTRPTYQNASVCAEWLTFSTFKSWMEKQDWEGKDLDKDLLYQGNTVYSPSTSLFISSEVNNMLSHPKSKQRTLPVGVHLRKDSGKFRAQYNNPFTKKLVTLGCFVLAEDAAKAYLKAKYALISKVASEQKEPLRSALLNYDLELS